LTICSGKTPLGPFHACAIADTFKRMPPDQIAEAQRMAREWMGKH
jgi:hypothetical protein